MSDSDGSKERSGRRATGDPVTCGDCGQVCKSERGLGTHRRVKHPGPSMASGPVTIRGTVEGKYRHMAGDPSVAAALRIAGLLDDPDTPARDASALSRELRQLCNDIDGRDDGKAAGGIDQLAARRQARRSGAVA